MYSVACTVTADMSALGPTLTYQVGADGKEYFLLALEIIVFLGLTALKAQICWMEGVRCP
jgi:hypothetical protein